MVDPRFYHLDTCFCPLPDGGAFWFPDAFDEYGQRAIREHVTDLIDVAPEEAMHFSCNAVVIDRDIDRVTGLAAEAAFFAVLSVPPLIFAMAGAIGYVRPTARLGPNVKVLGLVAR